MANLEESFGKRVRQLRTGIGMTQPQLAETIDMSVEWVRRIENGRASPSFDTITALAKALSVRPHDLFSEAPLHSANRVVVAVQGLSDEQVQWLIDGAHLLQQAGQSFGEGRGAPPRRGRAGTATKARRRT